MVPITEAQLPLPLTVVAASSPVVWVTQQPRSLRSALVRRPRTPIVSAATAPASLVAWAECVVAKVSWQVTSQMRSFPFLQGTTVISSGRILSAQCRPDGSKHDGTLAEVRALFMMSFISACL